jgi:RHH-type proline utilization regulon transcriptional repressor/proline dehydrogenase/delta 1-pyrroline-5-carboxylate dehydrogenase
VHALTIRVTSDDRIGDVLVAVSAAVAANVRLTLSIDPAVAEDVHSTLDSVADTVPGLIDPVQESDDALARRITERHLDRLRLLSRRRTEDADGDAVRRSCAQAFVTIVDDPVVRDGRIECLRYLNEQSVSYDYHRYGNLGRRGDEPRSAVL